MLSNKDIRNSTSFKVTFQRVNMGKGSQHILNVESKIQNYTANIFLFK